LELGRLVVVVVGDREGDIALFMAGLTAAGVEVHAFRDGSEALLHCGRNFPDVVVLNARLHDITSAQWTQAVRQKSTLPILVGVERADADAAGPALLAGGTSVVGRPYSAEEVLTSLSALQSSIAARRAAEGVLRHGPLDVDLQTFSARFRGRELELPLKELELLRPSPGQRRARAGSRGDHGSSVGPPAPEHVHKCAEDTCPATPCPHR
jgi:DNA-binding response OmpR family regulator